MFVHKHDASFPESLYILASFLKNNRASIALALGKELLGVDCPAVGEAEPRYHLEDNLSTKLESYFIENALRSPVDKHGAELASRAET